MAHADTIITRFAPSPTGFLHIGGARTALFNWLYARGRGGRFVLRIEDTDRERSTPEAEAAILDGLSWLGLDWDGEPVSQFAQADRHRAVADSLLAAGKAYKCYLSAAELDAGKAAVRETGAAFRSPWRDRDPAEAPKDAPFVVRFAGPTDGDVTLADQVQGDVTIGAKTLDDLVIVRSDGAPTYNLAVVVDDHDMGVTHVIRGDDHLVNAARQTLIYEALGWAVPCFAHIPLIHGPDGKKLSKRHGALGVQEYREMGYLPAGLRNYLLRLGWSHGDQELFTDDEAKALFDISAINRGASRLDFDKLDHVNGHHLAAMDDGALGDVVMARLSRSASAAASGEMSDSVVEQVRRAVPVLKSRAKHVVELVDQLGFVFAQRPIALNGKARKALNDDALGRMAKLGAALEACEDWTGEALSGVLTALAEHLDVGFGKIGGPARAALTGGLPAPDLSQTLFILGRDEVLGRLNDALATGADA